MPYSISGIVGTAFYGLIAYIDSISPSLGDIRLVAYRALVVMVLGGLDDSCRSCLEGVLVVDIVPLMESESGKWGELPVLVDGMFCISCGYGVVVYDHLILLPVALTGSKHHSSCLFQHRDEIRHNDSLGKEILAGTEEGHSLPGPFVLGGVIIHAVTCPDREVPVAQAVADRVGT